jgi:hypothetical protein
MRADIAGLEDQPVGRMSAATSVAAVADDPDVAALIRASTKLKMMPAAFFAASLIAWSKSQNGPR